MTHKYVSPGAGPLAELEKLKWPPMRAAGCTP